MSRLAMVLSGAVALMLVLGGQATVQAMERDVETTIWYQGFLADVDTGEPVNGTVTVVAALYDQPTGGTMVWGAETHAATTVTEGWFHVELGETVPLVTFGDPPYYLGLTVEGELLEPRQKLASVPMALHSAHADTALVGGGSGLWSQAGANVYRASGNVGIGTAMPTDDLHIVHDQDGLTGIVIENTDTGANSMERIVFENEDGGLAFVQVYDTGHFAYPGRMAVTNNRPGASLFLSAGGRGLFVDTTGYVGVGTTAPVEKLDVDGTARVTGFEMPSGASDGHVLTSDATGTGTWEAPGGDADWTVNGNNMYSSVTGDVGIGTSAPGSKLDVAGTVEATGLKMTTDPTEGYALTSDGAGEATWQPQHLVSVQNETTPETVGTSATQFGSAQVSLTVPGSGYIVCTSTVRVNINHANNSVSDHFQINHSESPSSMGESASLQGCFILPNEPIGGTYRSFCVSTTHRVYVAGTYTYYLVGRMVSGQDASDQFWNAHMTGIYYPD